VTTQPPTPPPPKWAVTRTGAVMLRGEVLSMKDCASLDELARDANAGAVAQALADALVPFTRVSIFEHRLARGEYYIGWRAGDLHGLKVVAHDAVANAREAIAAYEAAAGGAK